MPSLKNRIDFLRPWTLANQSATAVSSSSTARALNSRSLASMSCGSCGVPPAARVAARIDAVLATSSILLSVAERGCVPRNLSTAMSSSRVVRELLAASVAARRRPRADHDGHQIVGAELFVDELLRRAAHQVRVLRQRVRRVEHHHVDAAVKRPLVALHVGFDRLLREQRTLATLDRNVDRHEVR